MKNYALILAAVGALLGTPSAFASIVTYNATLSGLNEAPPNASFGTGVASITWDSVAHTMVVHVIFSGLLGTVTASHIHCCTAVADTGTVGVATVTPTLTGFPSGVTSGTYDHLFDLTSIGAFSPSFIAARGGNFAQAEADLFAGMAAQKAYLNIHTSTFPGGEIRGFLVQQVPEPGSLALLGLGLAGLGFSRRRKQAASIA